MSELKTFVVNLERDTLKRERILTRCHVENLDNLEVVKAADGGNLDWQLVNAVYRPDLAMQNIGRELSRGEIGCALSHLQIYRKIVAEGIELALVLEDDIAFSTQFKVTLSRLLAGQQPDEWELILLGHHTQMSRKIDTEHSLWFRLSLDLDHAVYRASEKAFGTYGYLINESGARRLLQCITTIDKPIDHYTGDGRYVNNYILKPSLVKVDDFLSDHYQGMSDRREIVNKRDMHHSLKKRMALRIGVYGLLNKIRFYARAQLRRLKRLKPPRSYR